MKRLVLQTLRWACIGGVLLGASSLATVARAESGVVLVRDVALSSPADGAAKVTVATSQPPRFSARVESGGKRLIVDIENAAVAGAPSAITHGNAVVAGI